MNVTKDTVSGAIFLALAALFGVTATNTLTIGTATRMGPGYFPIMLSVLLAILGIVIIIGGALRKAPPIGHIPIRALLMILATPVVFALLVRPLGLAAALFLSVSVAGLADDKPRLRTVFLVAAGLTLFSIAVFHYGLGISAPLVGPWLKG